MASVLLASFPGASSIITGGSCSRSKQSAKNYNASSYVTTSMHKNGKIQKEYFVMMSPRHNLKQLHKVTEEGSTSQECERKYVVNATSGQSFEYKLPQARDPKSIWGSVKNALDAFYKFSRPYAAFGTVFGATFNSLLAVEKLSDLSVPFFIGWLQVAVASICMHIFIVGVNQLYDVEIDKLNKPYLPLASGELSIRNGVIIVASSLILGFGFALIVGSWPLFWTLFVSSMLAAAYSVDETYFLVANTYQNVQTCVFKRPTTFPRQLIFCTAILSIFAVVIALFKDIPDMEGDEKFGVQSLSLHLGQKRVFWICVSLLKMAYGITILVGATSPFLWSKIFTVLGHAILASVLWYHAKSVDLKSNVALQSFYMFIWKLYTAELLLIPLFR